MLNTLNDINYYSRPEVSNSDLTWLEKYWLPGNIIIDLEAAYRFGSLIDALITEPNLVDYFKLTVGDEQYTKEEFEKAKMMKRAFFADNFCDAFYKQSETQKVSILNGFPISYGSLSFKLNVRCKYDFYSPAINLAGDLKSTACTSQKQFEESIRYFNYDRQAAFYMDIGGKSNFMFIGISKVNFKLFKVPIKRGSQMYMDGLDKYRDLAFRYWYLFGDVKQTA